MKIVQKKFSKSTGWETLRNDGMDPEQCNFVIAFASSIIAGDPDLFENLRNEYPEAVILISSASGEIIGSQVNDRSLSMTAISFEKTKIKTAVTSIDVVRNSFEAGYFLSRALDPLDLAHVMVIADGQKVNGSELVRGLQEYLPKGTIITGGLAGSENRKDKTLVGLNETPVEGKIAVIGFYGKNLTVTHGSNTGWEPFGPERIITKSRGNILYELGGEPALNVYKLYIELQSDLKNPVMLHPVCIRTEDESEAVIRTILSIDESNKSITFGASMPEGVLARMMRTTTDRLIDAAKTAAEQSVKSLLQKPELAILISCASRKQALTGRTHEEVKIINQILGARAAITGFYSYGGISPNQDATKFRLHNQTMSITTFSENNLC